MEKLQSISLDVEAKYPALLFKQQLTAALEKIYGKNPLLFYPASLLPVLSSLPQKVKITLPGFNISCSPQCPKGNVLEPANELSPNISEKIDINGTCSGFANRGIAKQGNISWTII